MTLLVPCPKVLESAENKRINEGTNERVNEQILRRTECSLSCSRTCMYSYAGPPFVLSPKPCKVFLFLGTYNTTRGRSTDPTATVSFARVFSTKCLRVACPCQNQTIYIHIQTPAVPQYNLVRSCFQSTIT